MVGKLKERDHLENLDVDVRILLIVFDINSMACIGFIWPRTGHTTGYKQVHKTSRSMKLRDSEYLRNYCLSRDKLLQAVNYNVHTVQIKNMAAVGDFILIYILKI